MSQRLGTIAFANECAPKGVRVNAILPGVTDTKLALYPDSDASSYTIGVCLNVDGGFLAG